MHVYFKNIKGAHLFIKIITNFFKNIFVLYYKIIQFRFTVRRKTLIFKSHLYVLGM